MLTLNRTSCHRLTSRYNAWSTCRHSLICSSTRPDCKLCRFLSLLVSHHSLLRRPKGTLLRLLTLTSSGSSRNSCDLERWQLFNALKRIAPLYRKFEVSLSIRYHLKLKIVARNEYTRMSLVHTAKALTLKYKLFRFGATTQHKRWPNEKRN